MVKWRTWRDQLSLFLIVGIPGIWVAQGMGLLPHLDQIVIGALILQWGNAVLFYFRKAGPANGGQP